MPTNSPTCFVFFTIILLQCLLFFSLPVVTIAPHVVGRSLQVNALGTILGSFGFSFALGIVTVGLLFRDLGPRFILITSTLLSSIFAHLNGLTCYFSTTSLPFELVTMAMRAIAGFSNGITAGALMACLPMFYTNDMGRVVATEAATAIFGIVAGPALGAASARFGSFYPPFAVLGCLFFIECVLIYSLGLLDEDDITCLDAPKYLFSTVKQPHVFFGMMHITVACVVMGLVTVLLHSSMDDVHRMSSIKVGFFFLLLLPSVGLVLLTSKYSNFSLCLSFSLMAISLYTFGLEANFFSIFNSVFFLIFSCSFAIAVANSFQVLSFQVKDVLCLPQDFIPSCFVTAALAGIGIGLGLGIGASVGGFLAHITSKRDATTFAGHFMASYSCFLVLLYAISFLWMQRSYFYKRERDSEEERKTDLTRAPLESAFDRCTIESWI